MHLSLPSLVPTLPAELINGRLYGRPYMLTVRLLYYDLRSSRLQAM